MSPNTLHATKLTCNMHRTGGQVIAPLRSQQFVLIQGRPGTLTCLDTRNYLLGTDAAAPIIFSI